MSFARRTDSTHRAVIDTLRALGWFILDTSRQGNGVPDCFGAKWGLLVAIEIKDGGKPESKRRLTSAEKEVHDAFAACGVTVFVVESVEQALAFDLAVGRLAQRFAGVRT